MADGKNAPKGGGAKSKGDGKPAGQGNAKTAGASGADISGYMGQIQGAIQSKFYDASSFAGKTCDLRIKLAPDGLLISVQAAGAIRLCVKLRCLPPSWRIYRSRRAMPFISTLRILYLNSSRNNG